VCTEIDSKSKIDINFRDIVKILNKNKILYWICHGTLLGIIRDNNLIPWDHDIDIAVWDSREIKLKIKKLMFKNDFVIKKKFYKNDGFQTFLKPGGREVDINFYKKKKYLNKTVAYVQWYAPRNNFCKLIEALAASKVYEGRYKNVVRLFRSLSFLFKFIKKKMIEKNYFYKGTGYTQPLDLIKKLRKIKFMGLRVSIPFFSKKYLNIVYGKNWMKPNQKFDYRESPSLRNV